MASIEFTKHFTVLQVVHHYCSVEGRGSDAQRMGDFCNVSHIVVMQPQWRSYLGFSNIWRDVPLSDQIVSASCHPDFVQWQIPELVL